MQGIRVASAVCFMHSTANLEVSLLITLLAYWLRSQRKLKRPNAKALSALSASLSPARQNVMRKSGVFQDEAGEGGVLGAKKSGQGKGERDEGGDGAKTTDGGKAWKEMTEQEREDYLADMTTREVRQLLIKAKSMGL